jgi:hypothetical protein
VAAAEKRVGAGRVIALTTTLDDTWNDLPKKPVYLPLVHQLMKHLARYEQPLAWHTVGDVVDVSARSKADRAILTPSNERRTMRTNDPGVLELSEQGIYEIRTSAAGVGRPDRIAVNIDPAESDLSELDSQELVALVTGRANQDTPRQSSSTPPRLTAAEAERRQGLWWYLLVAGLLLLAAETAVANHLSQKERFT